MSKNAPEQKLRGQILSGVAAPDSASTARPGSPDPRPAIPDHELIRRIGGGSYGEVWLARNIMGTYRAVKIVYRKSFANERPFEREFRGIQKFEPISRSHESQVDILHIGRGEDCFYYVMELADDANPPIVAADVRRLTSTSPTASPGADQSLLTSAATYSPKTLASEIQQRGRLPFDQCLEIGLALTTALAHLHKNGLVHRDVKPSNVIFVNGIPKLADIGLVTDFAGAVSFVGTEGFLPPEGPGTPQADIYSLGKVLYEISTGKDRQDFPEPPTLLEEFPDREQMLELGEIIKRACARDVRQRYATAELMHADLLLLKTGKSVRRTRLLERRLAAVTRVGVAAGLVALLAVGAYVVAHNQARRAKEVSLRETELRLEAEADKKKAQTEAAKSRQVAEFLQDMLKGVGPAAALGRNTEMLREIIDKAADELKVPRESDPRTRQNLAAGYETLGEFDRAEAVLREGLTLARRGLGWDPETRGYLVSLATLLSKRGRDAEAEEVFSQVLPAQGTPTMFRLRAEFRTNRGNWAGAAADFEQAAALAPDDPWMAHFLAPLLIKTGDASAYQKLRERMLRTFTQTDDPLVAERMAKACCLQPLSGPEIGTINRWVDDAVLATNHWAWPWFQLAKGFAEYRQGHLLSAVRWEETALQSAGTDCACELQSYAVLSMALHRLGRDADSRTALAKAVDIARTRLPSVNGGSFGNEWITVLFGDILIREANALIGTTDEEVGMAAEVGNGPPGERKVENGSSR